MELVQQTSRDLPSGRRSVFSSAHGWLWGLGLAILVGCEDLSREPGYLLEGGLAGSWQLYDRNPHGGAVPESLDTFTLQPAPGFADAESEDWLAGTLTDALGRTYQFSLQMWCDLGPCLWISEASWGGGGPKQIRIMPMINGQREDDLLLIAFEKASDGAVYPHDYERR